MRQKKAILGRILAIGDIHGCLDPLNLLLDRLRPAPSDTIVTLGDVVDRGPDSRGVIERLIALRSECCLVTLKGNHDEMMLAARDDAAAAREWQAVGGMETLESYCGGLSRVPEAHWIFLESCIDFWETDTHFFVHGNVYPDEPLVEQPKHKLFWGGFDGAQPHISGKIMVCGHTSQKSGRPKNLGYAVCIDTYAHGGQWLSCLDVGTGIVTQASIDGDIREVNLSDFIERPNEL